MNSFASKTTAVLVSAPRSIWVLILFPVAFFLSLCSACLQWIRTHLWIYSEMPLSTTAEKETAFLQSQCHSTAEEGRVKRQAWHCASTGALSNVVLRDEWLDPPKLGYVQIKVHAVGLNFADIFAVQGLYSATPTHAFTPGLEFAGEISHIPVGATIAQRTISGRIASVGDRVHGVTRFGSYATHINANILCLKHLPPTWTYAEGASILVQSLTAAYALFNIGQINSTPLTAEQLRNLPSTQQYLPYKRQLGPNHSVPIKRPVVLVHSAAGGVGLHALAMCLKIGAIPICTVSGKIKREFLVRKFKLLPEQVIDRSLCGYLKVEHVPTPPKSTILSHMKYYIKSIFRFTFAPVRQIIDRTIFFRRKQSKDYSFLLDYALKKVNRTVVDISLDSLLGNYFNPTLQHMSCGNSKTIIFGAASYSSVTDTPDFLHLAHEYFRRPVIDPMDLIPLNTSVSGFNLIWLWDQLEELQGLLTTIDALLPHPIVNITCWGVGSDMIQLSANDKSEPRRSFSHSTDGYSSDCETSSQQVSTSSSNIPIVAQPNRGMYNPTSLPATTPQPPTFIPNPSIIAPLGPHQHHTFVHPSVLYRNHDSNGFEHLDEALRYLQSGQHIGKVVVTVKHPDGDTSIRSQPPLAPPITDNDMEPSGWNNNDGASSNEQVDNNSPYFGSGADLQIDQIGV